MNDKQDANPALHEFNRRVTRWGNDFDPDFRRIVKCLGWACNMETHITFISVAGIQKKHKEMFKRTVHRATVFRQLAKLKAEDVLTVTNRKRANGSQRSNEYKLDFSRVIRDGQGMNAHLFDAPLPEDATLNATRDATPFATPMRPLELSSSRVTRDVSRVVSSEQPEDGALPRGKKKIPASPGGIDNTYWVAPSPPETGSGFVKAAGGKEPRPAAGWVYVELTPEQGKKLWSASLVELTAKYGFLRSFIPAAKLAENLGKFGKCSECECPGESMRGGKSLCDWCSANTKRRDGTYDSAPWTTCSDCGATLDTSPLMA